MRLQLFGILGILGCLVGIGVQTDCTAGDSISSEVETKTLNFEMNELLLLSGNTRQELVDFCKRNGILLQCMQEGKLDYSMQIELYGTKSTVCLEFDQDIIQEIYVKPEKATLSVWVHRFNELYGECIEIEKVPLKEQQEMKYITWLYENNYISIVRMNQNMYIYITPCDN